MNDKATVILAAAVIIVAACIVASFIKADDMDEKDGFRLGDSESNYALLDSDSNIAEGLVAKMSTRSSGFNSDQTILVTGVADGNVSYTVTAKFRISTTYDLSKFLPGGTMVWDLDYTADSPDPALTITKDGNIYTINGNTIPSGASAVHLTYQNLSITYDGSSVTNVQGKVISAQELDKMTYDDDSTYTTKDGKVWCEESSNEVYKNTVSVDKFYGYAFLKFDQSAYDGATLVQDTGRYGNVNCTVYIANGTLTSDGSVLQDYRIYVYDGYVLYQSGIDNGDKQTLDTGIFVPE